MKVYIKIKGIHLRVSWDTMIDSTQRDRTESSHPTFELLLVVKPSNEVRIHQDKPLFHLMVHLFTLLGQRGFQDPRIRVLIQDVLDALDY